MFELSKGGKLPLSPVLTPAWVQLPCGAWLGGTEPATFRTVRWGAGLPFSEKKNADFIQKGWKEANKVWANLGLLCPAFHSPWLQAPFIYPHSPTPPPLNYLTGTEIILGICWEGMWLWKMQFAHFRCPRRPDSPIADWEPRALLCLEFSEMGGFQTTFSEWLVMLTWFILPSSFCLRK